MTATAPLSSPCNVNEATITSDFLALVGFAARLGTCVNNDTAADSGDAKSVRDEAMLLMSLLMGDKAEEILSDVKESRCVKRKRPSSSSCSSSSDSSVRPTTTDSDNNHMGAFSFTFPSLSLQPDGHSEELSSSATERPSEIADEGGDDDDDDEIMDHPPPSQLLGRTQQVHDKNLIRDSSESMAHNVLESFGAALVWRAKTWIKSLTNVLALKEQKRIDARRAAAAAAAAAATINDEGTEENIEASHQDDDDDDEENENYDDLMNSKEMQIIDAIVRSAEEVSVVNIKTTFRVLPTCTSRQSCDDEDDALPSIPSGGGDGAAPKTNASSPHDNVVHAYKVTHKLLFEATISMTSNDDVRYNGVTLQAPGFIQGTFAQNAESLVVVEEGGVGEGEGGGGDETLTGISVTLDTDALALSLERQSRLVVRQAAEAALMTARGMDSSSPSARNHYESPHVHHSIISPRYVLMSPIPAADRFVQEHYQSSTMLPSIPSKEALNGESESNNNSKASSSSMMVSSSEGCSSDSSADTRLSLTPSTKKIKLPAPLSPSFPALLSVANEERNRGE